MLKDNQAGGIVFTAKNPFIDYIKRRIKKGFNFVGLIAGGTGSGKTYSAMSICEQLDPEFSADRIAFDTAHFVKILRDPKLKAGSCVIYDEGGVGINARNFWSEQNKGASYILQTFRFKRLVVFFTTPAKKFIDSQARSLFSAILQPQRIDRVKKICMLRCYLLNYNVLFDKQYVQFLRVWRKNKGYLKLKHIFVAKPGKELTVMYEIRKREYSSNLYTEVDRTLNIMKENEMPLAMVRKKPMTDKQRAVYDLRLKGYTMQQIGDRLGTDHSNVSKILEAVRKKGFDTARPVVTQPPAPIVVLPNPSIHKATLIESGGTTEK